MRTRAEKGEQVGVGTLFRFFEDNEGLGSEVTALLADVNVVIVGDNSEANKALARGIAPRLSYNKPLSTEDLMLRLGNASSMEDFIAENGLEGLGSVEAALLEQLSTQLRCCIATAGGGSGAAAREDSWRHLFGSITVWIDDSVDEHHDPEELEHPQAYQLADVRVRLGSDKEACREVASEEACVAAEQMDIGDIALRAIKKLVQDDRDLCGKKREYVKLGCLGDWPVLDAETPTDGEV